MAWTWNYVLENGVTHANDANEVMSNLNQIVTALFQISSANFVNAAILDATTHGDLSSSLTTLHSGSSVKLSDSGSYFTTDNAEAALQQIASFVDLSSSTTHITHYIGTSYQETTPTSISVVIPADTAKNGIKVTMSAYINNYNGSGAPGESVVPLCMSSDTHTTPVQLSSAAERHREFEMLAVGGGADGGCVCSTFCIIDSNLTTKSNWEEAVDFEEREYTFSMDLFDGNGWGRVVGGMYKLIVEVF